MSEYMGGECLIKHRDVKRKEGKAYGGKRNQPSGTVVL